MMRQFGERGFDGINEANNFGCTFFGGNHSPMFLIGFLLLIITALIIIMIYKHHKISHTNTTPPTTTNNNALDLLNERLAKGEITPEEYTKIKELLKTPQ